MFRSLILLFALVAIVPAHAQLRGRLRELIAKRRESVAAPGKQEMSYGTDPLQKLDYWRPAGFGSPLVIYVHGGGWKRGDKELAAGDKATHYLQQGYAFASLGYRLVPDCKVEDQAQDIADAIAYLIQNAEKFGFDGTRVALMGHSAGAHLVALVGTDMRYLKKAGLGSKALRGVIPLDGACYDVPRQIAEGGDFMHDTYLQAFGTDPERQKALSPVFHAAAPNAPSFLILHVQREDGTAQSKELGEALRKADTPAIVKGFEGRGLMGHMEINRKLGDPSYPATPVVDAWLKNVFRQ
ncbi:MAG: alpha/beta hydrolase [Verrucomicrobiaceae bacterium]